MHMFHYLMNYVPLQLVLHQQFFEVSVGPGVHINAWNMSFNWFIQSIFYLLPLILLLNCFTQSANHIQGASQPSERVKAKCSKIPLGKLVKKKVFPIMMLVSYFCWTVWKRMIIEIERGYVFCCSRLSVNSQLWWKQTTPPPKLVYYVMLIWHGELHLDSGNGAQWLALFFPLPINPLKVSGYSH